MTTPTVHIVTLATLHKHDWCPGTRYVELVDDVVPMFKTAQDLYNQVTEDTLTYGEFFNAVREIAQ